MPMLIPNCAESCSFSPSPIVAMIAAIVPMMAVGPIDSSMAVWVIFRCRNF